MGSGRPRCGSGVCGAVLLRWYWHRLIGLLGSAALACLGDAAFNDDIGGSADHDKVLDIIATDQHQPAAGVDRCCVEHRKARHAVLAAADKG